MDDEIKSQADTAEAGAAGQADDVQKELDEVKKQRDEYLAGWQRAKADFQNYRRDEMERLTQAVNFAGEDLIREMISAMDSFDLGLLSLEKAGPVDRGIYMIRAQIEDMLKKKGLSRIQVEPGSAPDHLFVETVAEVESEIPAGKIVSEIEAGYMLNGKVLRPARVMISKGKKQ